MKKKFNLFKQFILMFVLFFAFFNLTGLKVKATSEPPNLNSNGAILIDATTGQVLYSKNGEQQFYPASTTKIITALIVLENAKLDEIVTISKTAASAEGSSIGLREGETCSVKELLLGLLLESGNDCANALAEHVSGSIENFANLMNKKAKEIGATNSNFTNPSGLPDPNHVTTAHDLALFMREAIKNPDFIEIDNTNSYQFPPSNLDGAERWVNNHNYILNPNSTYYYKYSSASKKGYTTAANFTNVISATKDGHTLVSAFLNGEGISQVYADVAALFDYGFNNFTFKTIYKEGDKVDSFTLTDGTTIPILIADDVYYTVENDKVNSLDISIDYELPSDLNNMSFTRGDTLTSGKVKVNGEVIATVNLASGADYVYETFYDKNENEINTILILAIIFLCLLFLNRFRRRRLRRKARIRKVQLNSVKTRKAMNRYE